MEGFARHGRRATFFLDVCESATWGRDFMKETVRRIEAGGHEVELHIHPRHWTGPDRPCLLSDYPPEEQAALFSRAVDEFRFLVGRDPVAFRAGGFGLDDATLGLLKRHGIPCDASFMWRRPGCRIRPERIASPSRLQGLTEIPMTPVAILGSPSWPLRVSSLDFNWMPLCVIKGVLDGLRRKGAGYAVFLMHSSSLFLRCGAREFSFSPRMRGRFGRLLDFLDAGGYETSTVREALSDPSLFSPGPDIVTGVGPVSQYRIALFQARVGRGFNRGMSFFWWAHIVVAALLLGAALVGVVRWMR